MMFFLIGVGVGASMSSNGDVVNPVKGGPSFVRVGGKCSGPGKGSSTDFLLNVSSVSSIHPYVKCTQECKETGIFSKTCEKEVCTEIGSELWTYEGNCYVVFTPYQELFKEKSE